MSKGEKRVFDFLRKTCLSIEREYTFDDLFSDCNVPLRYDFALFDDNVLLCIIEYDGEFHYKKMYEDHDFEKQQKYDAMKNEYCKKNNIPILRIPYWEYENIEYIIANYLDELKINYNIN